MFKKISPLLPSQILYSIILFIVMIAVFFVYKDIDRSFSIVEKNYLQLQSQDIGKFSQNISEALKKIVLKDPIIELKRNVILQQKLNNILTLFSTKHYRYIYILYLDKKGRLRYLADGSYEKSQRGVFGQKFDPESDSWKEAIAENKMVHVTQHSFTDLWSTYYFPMTVWSQKHYLLVFDISLETLDGFRNLLLPFRNLLRVISIILIFLFIMSLVWSILFYLQRRKTTIDPLTKLYNRNMLYEVQKHINIQTTSVILADMDHFKRINDRYGHDAGDVVLQHAARFLMKATRAEDILIRYGGEEFLILINGISDKETLIKILQRISDEFTKHTIRYQDNNLGVTLSMGVVTPQKGILDFSEMITIADKMLYIAKTTGRNKFVIYGDEALRKKRTLLFSEVVEAIENNNLSFLYQPIYDAKTLTIEKFEILVRLYDKNGFIHYPDEFIPIIRGTTVYRELSKSLIQTACEKMAQKDIQLSINFDINDFMDETLFEELYDMLKQHESIVKRLSIELLEESPVEDLDALVIKVQRLKNIGVKIAIDDFGKGYAGFNYILHFRPHVLKVDRSVISQFFTHPYIPSIVDSIITVCHQLDIKTTAEGIEDERTLKKMQEVGFDTLQGYYLKEAVSWNEVQALI